ncbi:cilia- and flagella-associated protein 251-like [Rhynchophorus ferrugineus]|uniref:cilia- and flagella-associated protein 251-like n=1 Tax=Rhynchophorus ferrugineus TaxID=354439 RepID=UPI003FCD7E4D
MSEDSISYGEDKENLLYISKKINVDDFGLGEEGLFRESISLVESDISIHNVEKEIEILEQSSGKRTLSNPYLAMKLRPFDLKWSFGINPKVGLINLTDNVRKEIFFSSVHNLVLYNYCTREMKHIEGHQTMISCISSDASGSWLVSSDDSKDGCLIVWDSKTLSPIFTRFNLYTCSSVLLATLSNSAKYLTTIGANDDAYYQIDLWLWTLGEEKSNDTFLVHKTHGVPIKICYNPDQEEHIMIVFETHTFFLIWDTVNKKFINMPITQITNKQKIGTLTGGTYINECHESFVSSSRGCILVFRSTLYTKQYEGTQLNNSKIYINAVKVTPSSIGVITTTDGKLVIGDTKGHIYFFDKRIKILYWIRNMSLGAITDISFSLTPKIRKYIGDKIIVPVSNFENDEMVADCEYIDIQEEIEQFIAIDAPFDASLLNETFIVTDFFVSTADCNIFAINFIQNRCTPLFHIADANISAIDAHDEKPYLAIGYHNGRVSLLNFDTKDQIATILLNKTEEGGEADMVSCIKYSYESLHLICGRQNGEIWILEPIVLRARGSPFRYSKFNVEKISFSHNSLQFAYYDSNLTIFLFNYNTQESHWEFRGKIRSHYEAINDIKFFFVNNKSTLFTIGCDRYLVEYNNASCDEDEPFSIAMRERIEQTAIPLHFIYYSKLYGQKRIGYFLVADDKHKLKLLHEVTKVPRSLALGPAFGCFRNSCIKKMEILPDHDCRYMTFMCKQHIGIHILPPDGNPYKYTGCLAHPVEVCDFVISHDGNHIFTFGVKDRCILQWEIKERSVEIINLMGGTGLEPYYCLLDGGKNGWLFHEMQDLFFYMQILQHENIDLPRRVSDCINLTEIPDLVKTCGFYPTDFELETMMIDIRYRDFDDTGKVRDEISFIDFVKLFINHRPPYGYSMDILKSNFKILCEMADYPTRNRIDMNDFVYLLQSIGEPTTHLHKCLTTLLRVYTYGENNFNFLPEEISLDFFLNELLGIDSEPKIQESPLE